MAEELKACPFCGGKAETVQFTKKRWTVECFADGCGAGIISQGDMQTAIAAWNNRAQLPSQGGEAVAQVSIDADGSNRRLTWYSTKAMQDTPVWTKLYTHPADQVADDLTMVKVSRELLVKLLDEGRRAETWAAQEELRTLLAKPCQHIPLTSQYGTWCELCEKKLV